MTIRDAIAAEKDELRLLALERLRDAGWEFDGAYYRHPDGRATEFIAAALLHQRRLDEEGATT